MLANGSSGRSAISVWRRKAGALAAAASGGSFAAAYLMPALCRSSKRAHGVQRSRSVAPSSLAAAWRTLAVNSGAIAASAAPSWRSLTAAAARSPSNANSAKAGAAARKRSFNGSVAAAISGGGVGWRQRQRQLAAAAAVRRRGGAAAKAALALNSRRKQRSRRRHRLFSGNILMTRKWRQISISAAAITVVAAKVTHAPHHRHHILAVANWRWQSYRAAKTGNVSMLIASRQRQSAAAWRRRKLTAPAVVWRKMCRLA